MKLARARIVRGEEVTGCEPLERRPGVTTRIIRREILEARQEAERILSQAEEQARAQLLSIEERESQLLASAAERGYQEGLVRATALVMNGIGREQRENASSRARVVELARLLAERILGRALEVEPSAIEDMARTLLLEVRGARRMVFRTNPMDVPALSRALSQVSSVAEVTVEGVAALERGDFQLVTDIGSLEGALGSRLEMLARKLAEGLDT